MTNKGTKKYLIWLDILGFEERPNKVAQLTSFSERKIRKDFINVIKNKISELKTKELIRGANYGNRDDWVLVADSMSSTFEIISIVLDHNTEIKYFEKVPLEIAIGIAVFDRWSQFDDTDLLIENGTIHFLKTYIVNYYRKWYKETNAKTIDSTFILLTEAAYQELDPLDKKACIEIKFDLKSFFVTDVTSVERRGRMHSFLKKIKNISGGQYARIDEIYVPPLQFEEILETLQEKRIVFITGTKEFGKTYTAVRLLWQYFNIGYEPIWRIGEEPEERLDAAKRLLNIKEELKPGRIVYFEDPFGRSKYENREGLEREIGTIIDIVKNIEDAYVVITSREEIFKEFEKQKISEKDIKEFEKSIGIKYPSYDLKKREEILLLWANNEDCQWLAHEELKESILFSLSDDKILPTPLSIRDFVLATARIVDEDVLKEELHSKSKETEKAFAVELATMSEDKILFLLFPHVHTFKLDFIEELYARLISELSIKDAWEFERLLLWFKKDKINIIRDSLSFSHPSYNEAVEIALFHHNYYPNKRNERLLAALLLKLSTSKIAAHLVIFYLLAHYNELPMALFYQTLFVCLKSNGSAIDILIDCSSDFFEAIPEDFASKVLIFLLQGSHDMSQSLRLALALSFLSSNESKISNLIALQNNIIDFIKQHGIMAKTDCSVLGLCLVAQHYNEFPDLADKFLASNEHTSNKCAVVAILANYHVVSERWRNHAVQYLNKMLNNISKVRQCSMCFKKALHDNSDNIPDHLKQLLCHYIAAE